MKTRRYSERKRSPIFLSIAGLNELAQACFPRRHEHGRCGSQILGALLRAATAFNDASEGRRVARNLEVVRTALGACETAFLFLKGRLPDQIVRDAIRRIDQIQAALDEIANASPKKWPEKPLPELPEAHPQSASGLWSMLQKISDGVKAFAAAHLPPSGLGPPKDSGGGNHLDAP